jgi:O-antigen/teichoic acid export membrane protein
LSKAGIAESMAELRVFLVGWGSSTQGRRVPLPDRLKFNLSDIGLRERGTRRMDRKPQDQAPLPTKPPSKILSDGISLKASMGYSFLGQVFYLISQLVILSALAHFRGPAAVGEFGLALAITTPLFLLLNMGFRTAQAVDIGEQFSFATYGGTRLLLTLSAVIISIVLAALYVDMLSTFLIVVAVVLAKMFESVSNLAYGAFQQAGRVDLMAVSFGLRGSLTVVAFVSLLLLGADTATALAAQVVVWGLIGLFFDYPRASRLVTGMLTYPRFAIGESWRLLRHSAPLGGGLLANSLQMTVTRLMVEGMLGLEALGLFTAVAYFQQASVTASNSVSTAIMNKLARLTRSGQRDKLRKVILGLLLLLLGAGLAGVAICYYFGDLLLLVLFGKSYIPAAPLLVIISLSICLRMISTLPQSLLFAEQRYKEFLAFQVVSLGLAAGLGYYFIAQYGLLGAGYVLLAVALFRLVVFEIIVMLRPRAKAHNANAPRKDDET